MAKYKIVDDTWLDFPESGPRLVRPFTEVTLADDKREMVPTVIDYAGWPNAAMEPLDDEGRELVEAVHRLRPTGQLPRSPKAWRKQRAEAK